jgi:hypothetical protein
MLLKYPYQPVSKGTLINMINPHPNTTCIFVKTYTNLGLNYCWTLAAMHNAPESNSTGINKVMTNPQNSWVIETVIIDGPF